MADVSQSNIRVRGEYLVAGLRFSEIRIDGYGIREREIRQPSGRSLVLFVRAGAVRIVLPDLGRRELRTGQWAMLRTPTLRGAASKDTNLLAVTIPARTLREWLEHASPNEGNSLRCFVCPQMREPGILTGTASERFRWLAEQCRRPEAHGLHSRLQLQGRCFEWLSELTAQPEISDGGLCAAPCNNRDAERIRDVAAYVDRYPEEEHSLADLSRRFHLNEFKLKQGFKAIFGHTVFTHLRNVRVDRAALILRDGNGSILEAANAVGYSNPSHFARAFRRRHGLLPKAYQRLHRSNG